MSIKKIAEKAGTSPATVSRILKCISQYKNRRYVPAGERVCKVYESSRSQSTRFFLIKEWTLQLLFCCGRRWKCISLRFLLHG